MINYEVKYTKGHLVEIKTGKRIFLKRGGSFHIMGDDDQFEERDNLQPILNPLNPIEKLKSLSRDNRGFFLEKIADVGTEFYYRIGLSMQTSEDKAREFYFNAIIDEDLYVKSKDGKNWSLCPCICKTIKCIKGDVQMIESVPGTSLSNLFGNVVTFYFAFQRSTACNAFRTFYFAFDDYAKLDKNLLDTKRKVIANTYKE